MNDRDVVRALIAEIKNQLGIYGVSSSDIYVGRANQPTRQNAGAKLYNVYLSPINNTDIGWGRYRVDGGTKVTHTKQKSYQINTVTDYDHVNDVGMPAQDLAHVVHDMLEHPDAIQSLLGEGVNVMRCTDVRPLYWMNEQDEYEPMPSFDIVVNYSESYVKPSPYVTEVTGTLEQV